MCDLIQLRSKEPELMAQVNETDDGLQAAQELLLLRRQCWAHADKCAECQAKATAVSEVTT